MAAREATHEQVSLLNRTVPIIDAKTSDLNTSLAQSEARVVRVEKSVESAQKDLVSGQQSTTDILHKLSAMEKLTQNPPGIPQLPKSADHRISSLETKTNLLEKDLSSALNKLATTQRSSDLVWDQVVALDRRVPVVEAKVDRLERSVVENKKDVSTMRKFLQTLERRVPAVEAKANKLERSIGQTQEELTTVQTSLITTEDRLVVVDDRISAVERKVDRYPGSFGQAHADGSPPARHSPYVFPVQLRDSPPPTSRGASPSGQGGVPSGVQYPSRML